MEVLGDLTLSVSQIYLGTRSFKSDIGLSLARHFMKSGLDEVISIASEDGDRQGTSEALCAAIVANWNVAHGIELFLKIVLVAAGKSISDTHNIKSNYYHLERIEPILAGNFEAASQMFNMPELLEKRKETFATIQKNYTRMRYFPTGSNDTVQLADRRTLLFICVILLGTFAPGHLQAFLKSLTAG